MQALEDGERWSYCRPIICRLVCLLTYWSGVLQALRQIEFASRHLVNYATRCRRNTSSRATTTTCSRAVREVTSTEHGGTYATTGLYCRSSSFLVAGRLACILRVSTCRNSLETSSWINCTHRCSQQMSKCRLYSRKRSLVVRHKKKLPTELQRRMSESSTYGVHETTDEREKKLFLWKCATKTPVITDAEPLAQQKEGSLSCILKAFRDVSIFFSCSSRFSA